MSKQLTCFLIEDEPLAIRRILFYIENRKELKLLGSADDVKETQGLLPYITQADILFLDLYVSGGDASFLEPYLKDLPHLVMVSALPPSSYPEFIKKEAPLTLQKPITQEQFNNCVNIILELDARSKELIS